jgi:hypothetical protein
VGRQRVGVTAFSEMSFMFGIWSMTVSGELAKVLGIDHGLRPDGKASIS